MHLQWKKFWNFIENCSHNRHFSIFHILQFFYKSQTSSGHKIWTCDDSGDSSRLSRSQLPYTYVTTASSPLLPSLPSSWAVSVEAFTMRFTLVLWVRARRRADAYHASTCACAGRVHSIPSASVVVGPWCKLLSSFITNWPSRDKCNHVICLSHWLHILNCTFRYIRAKTISLYSMCHWHSQEVMI